MTAPVLFVASHHGELPAPFTELAAAGDLVARMEWDVTQADIAAAAGVVTTMHLDMVGALRWRDAFAALLDRGGRIAISGHVTRPFVPGVEPEFVPTGPGRAALRLAVLAEHPVFDGIDRLAFQTRRGVAGFYGRGHNPMPPGGEALTGVGANLAPVDWVWNRDAGGSVFSHAGNDVWTSSDDDEATRRFATNLVRWCGEGRKS